MPWSFASARWATKPVSENSAGGAPEAGAPHTLVTLILETGLETENAATRSVGSAADRELAVRRSDRHGLVEWHKLAFDHPARRGGRRPRIALSVVVAAAPFAGAVLEAAAVDPVVVCECAIGDEKCRYKNKQ